MREVRQSLEAWLTHSPGLKVAFPSTPFDAKGLLLSCIFDEDPCIMLESIKLLAAAARMLADRCIDGLEADEEVARSYAEGSPSIVTPLNRVLGYDEAAAIAKQALKENKTIRAVVLERGHVTNGTLTEEQLDAALDVLRMTRP